MKAVFLMPAACAFAFVLTSCPDTRSIPQGSTGPFDSHGNYVEALADDPSKWRKPGSSPDEPKPDAVPPTVASRDQPPQNSNPLPPAKPDKPAPVIAKTEVTKKPKHTEEKPEPTVVKTKHHTEKTEPVLVKPKHPVEKSGPEPVKANSKPKPKSSRYVVKSGDSLSSIASHNGTSVSALQRANGISGTLIRDGQTLTIPKK